MVEAKVSVRFRSGDPAARARVTGEIVLRALGSGERRLNRVEGETDAAGNATLEIDTRPVIGPTTFEFSARLWDASGVTWVGTSRVTWTLVRVRAGEPYPDRRAAVVLEREALQAAFELDAGVRDRIRTVSNGDLLLSDIDEMLDALRSSLPSATLALAGKVIDGALKIRGRSERWWEPRLDEMTLGQLMDATPVKAKIEAAVGEPGHRRLKALGVTIRNLATHQLLERVSIEEAQAAVRVVFDFIPRWWVWPAGTGVGPP